MAFTSWSPQSLTEVVRFTMPLDWNERASGCLLENECASTLNPQVKWVIDLLYCTVGRGAHLRRGSAARESWPRRWQCCRCPLGTILWPRSRPRPRVPGGRSTRGRRMNSLWELRGWIGWIVFRCSHFRRRMHLLCIAYYMYVFFSYL